MQASITGSPNLEYGPTALMITLVLAASLLSSLLSSEQISISVFYECFLWISGYMDLDVCIPGCFRSALQVRRSEMRF